MKDNRCFICKFKQLDTPKTNDDLIYDPKGNTAVISLCYVHSVELFKSGQKVFLQRHRHIFTGNFGVENDLELMNYFNPSDSGRTWF